MEYKYYNRPFENSLSNRIKVTSRIMFSIAMAFLVALFFDFVNGGASLYIVSIYTLFLTASLTVGSVPFNNFQNSIINYENKALGVLVDLESRFARIDDIEHLLGIESEEAFRDAFIKRIRVSGNYLSSIHLLTDHKIHIEMEAKKRSLLELLTTIISQKLPSFPEETERFRAAYQMFFYTPKYKAEYDRLKDVVLKKIDSVKNIKL